MRILYRSFRTLHRLGRWTRQRFTPGGKLLLGILFFSALIGVDTTRSLAFQVVALTAALLVPAVVSAVGFRVRFQAERRLPLFGTVDQPLHYQVVLSNPSRHTQRGLWLLEELRRSLPTWEEFRQAHEPGEQRRNWFDRKVGYPRWEWLIAYQRGAEAVDQALPTLPAETEVEVDMCLIPRRRGIIVLANLCVIRLDPFGLFKALQRLYLPQSITILPKRYPCKGLLLPGARQHQVGGVHLAGSVGDAEEFISLREYRPGDPLRHIHWRSWAKQGKPIVKEYQEEFFVRHALVLDTFAAAEQEADFEEAISIAASFCAVLPQQDALLDLMFMGTQAYRFTGGRGLNPPSRMLELLASVTPSTAQTFSQLSSLVGRHITDLSGCLCVFLQWDEDRKDLVSALLMHGLPVQVFVVNSGSSLSPTMSPDLGPMAEQPQFFHRMKPGEAAEVLARL